MQITPVILAKPGDVPAHMRLLAVLVKRGRKSRGRVVSRSGLQIYDP